MNVSKEAREAAGRMLTRIGLVLEGERAVNGLVDGGFYVQAFAAFEQQVIDAQRERDAKIADEYCMAHHISERIRKGDSRWLSAKCWHASGCSSSSWFSSRRQLSIGGTRNEPTTHPARSRLSWS